MFLHTGTVTQAPTPTYDQSHVRHWGFEPGAVQAPSPPTHLHVCTRTSRALVCDRLAHASPDIRTCRVHAVARHRRWELCAVRVGRCASNTLGCGWLHRESARAPPSPSNTALLVRLTLHSVSACGGLLAAKAASHATSATHNAVATSWWWAHADE
jgi:hypothetical protein